MYTNVHTSGTTPQRLYMYKKSQRRNGKAKGYCTREVKCDLNAVSVSLYADLRDA